MSQPHDSDVFTALNRIDQQLAKYVQDTVRQRLRPPNPHALMELLKEPGVTPARSLLGDLLAASLLPDLLPTVRWVVFHFSSEPTVSDRDEVASRNWIAVQRADQALVNAVHRSTIGEGTDYISAIYAPSVVAERLESVNPQLASHLHHKWWLYWLHMPPHDGGSALHQRCMGTHDDANFLCFVPHQAAVHVVSCRNDHCSGGDCLTLGALLGGEAEDVAANRFDAFVKLIVEVNGADYAVPGTLRCSHYIRVPVFFWGMLEEYMTEIFIAIDAPERPVECIVNIAHQIVPPLRLCASLINSHVASVISEERLHQLLIKVISHGLGNWCGQARSNALEARDALSANDRDTFNLCMAELIEDCGIGVLVSEGLRQHIKRDVPLTLGRLLSSVRTTAGLAQAVILDCPEELEHMRIPHATLLVISELFDNAMRAQRNQGFGRCKMALSIRCDSEGNFSLSLRNAGKIRANKLFMPDKGLSMCRALLRHVGGSITVAEDGDGVCARILVPRWATEDKRS